MNLRRSLPILALLGLCVGAPSRGAADLRDGDVLGPANWEEAKGLLPDEILEHYHRGEYVNHVMDIAGLGRTVLLNPPDLLAATRANRGRYALTPGGSIVDTKTGKQPTYIAGLPFDPIDPGDPQAATKIVWNSFYATWYRGDCHFLTEIVMLGRSGVERRVVTDVLIRMYDGAPEAQGRDNPDNVLFQTLARVVSPSDLNGTVSLTWRFRDPEKHDTLWTYVPGLRRTRQLSPLNRSDGFMGSDVSLDDGPFFDGKPEDFTFRLLNHHDQLVIMDPYSLRGEAELRGLPEGGWRIIWKDVPRIGADDPAWRGLPWAPVSSVLVRRPMWIVEAIPKDPNYLYGRILLRFDAERYLGSWASKYDRAGTLVSSYQVSQGSYYAANDGRGYVSAGGIAAQIAENFIYKRATVMLFPPRNPQNPADYRVPTVRDLFNPEVLVRIGR
jgi:hypothetical protein